MLIELQAMMAWEDVPITSSSVDASMEVLLDKLADVFGAISVDEARAGETNTVDIGDRGRRDSASSSRSLGEGKEIDVGVGCKGRGRRRTI